MTAHNPQTPERGTKDRAGHLQSRSPEKRKDISSPVKTIKDGKGPGTPQDETGLKGYVCAVAWAFERHDDEELTVLDGCSN